MNNYRFYEQKPQSNQGMNCYRIVERRKSTDPKVGDLTTILYLLAQSQEDAKSAIARDLGAGQYIPVLVEKNGKKVYC